MNQGMYSVLNRCEVAWAEVCPERSRRAHTKNETRSHYLIKWSKFKSAYYKRIALSNTGK
jgi:hypothetical protein